MEKNNPNISMEEVLKLAKSPAGQQLMAMLKQQDRSKLEQAAAQAKSGDFSQASQTLRAMLASPEAQKLMKELGGK